MNIDVNSDMQISAKYAVKAALEKYGLALNYSEESLQALETILIQANQQFSGLSKESKLSEPSVQAIARMWGSYLGEVTRRKCGGIWVKNNGDLILTINGQNFYPIEIVYQYITNYTKSSIIEYFLDINRRFNCTKVGKTSEKSSTYPYIITAIILGIILIITLLLFGLDSSNNSTPIPPKYIRVTEENFGDDWPFNVPQGTIECWGDYVVLFRTTDGEAYGLTGWTVDQHGYKDIKESGLVNKGLSPFISYAVKFCLQ